MSPRAAGQDELSAALDRTLADEMRANERIIADVRVMMFGLAATLQFAGRWVPFLNSVKLPLYMPLTLVGGFLMAVALAVAVRKSRHHQKIGLIAPVIDATWLVVEHVSVWDALKALGIDTMGVSASFGITCSLLAATGACRLTAGRAWWTSSLALAAFAVGNGLALNRDDDPRSFIFAFGLLFGVCLLSARMTGVTRRAVQGEVAKAMLGRFLPASVIASAHLDPLALLTEPRSVDATIVSTDLRGFTAFSEKLSPVEVLAFLNDIHGACARVIHAHGGTVDKFIGDGMLSVFGAPAPLADHAQAAIRAARALRQVVTGLNATRTAQGMPALAMGIGVHSGPVVIGCLGGSERLEFTVLGDTVNTTSRLEGATKEKGVDALISEETAKRAGSLEGLTDLGEVQLRGRGAGLKVYSLGLIAT